MTSTAVSNGGDDLPTNSNPKMIIKQKLVSIKVCHEQSKFRKTFVTIRLGNMNNVSAVVNEFCKMRGIENPEQYRLVIHDHVLVMNKSLQENQIDTTSQLFPVMLLHESELAQYGYTEQRLVKRKERMVPAKVYIPPPTTAVTNNNNNNNNSSSHNNTNNDASSSSSASSPVSPLASTTSQSNVNVDSTSPVSASSSPSAQQQQSKDVDQQSSITAESPSSSSNASTATATASASATTSASSPAAATTTTDAPSSSESGGTEASSEEKKKKKNVDVKLRIQEKVNQQVIGCDITAKSGMKFEKIQAMYCNHRKYNPKDYVFASYGVLMEPTKTLNQLGLNQLGKVYTIQVYNKDRVNIADSGAQ